MLSLSFLDLHDLNNNYSSKPFSIDWNIPDISNTSKNLIKIRKVNFKNGLDYELEYQYISETCLYFIYLSKFETRHSDMLNDIVAVRFFKEDEIPLLFKRPTTDEKAYFVLRNGLVFSDNPGVVYRYAGHSNSGLSDRRGKQCILLPCKDTVTIFDILERISNFSDIKPIHKQAKRIAQLFSKFTHYLTLENHEYKIIKDVQNEKYVFTDGCGFMSTEFAKKIMAKLDLDYVPSVVQFRYKGFKGILVHVPELTQYSVQFRESMKKFDISHQLTDLNEFGIVEVNRIIRGFLNTQIIVLLDYLGIKNEIFISRLARYIDLLRNVEKSTNHALNFMRSFGNRKMIEKIKRYGIDPDTREFLKEKIAEDLIQIKKKERKLNDYKCRNRVPIDEARCCFGVADPYGILEEEQCYFSPSFLEKEDEDEFNKCTRVMVTRNPCYYPGDLRVLNLVRSKSYEHLKDCIVFPVNGKRPEGDKMSGGDLDGDLYFVTWNKELLPNVIEPFNYQFMRNSIVVYKPSESIGNIIYSKQSYDFNNEEDISLISYNFGSVDFFRQNNNSLTGFKDKEFKEKSRQQLTEYFGKHNKILLGKLDYLLMKYLTFKDPCSEEYKLLNKCMSIALDSELDVEEQNKIEVISKKVKDLKSNIYDRVQREMEALMESFVTHWLNGNSKTYELVLKKKI